MIKIKVKFIFKCLMIIMVPYIFNFCFVSDVNSYTRVMLDELTEDGYIDVLFLGSSHTYRSYNVELIENSTNLNVFCAGSSAQQLQGSYYILREAQENNGVGTVLLDMAYIVQAYEEPRKTQTYIIADFLNDKKIKYEYLYDAFGMEGVINGFFPFLHGFKISPSVLMEHLTRKYMENSYEYVTYDNEAYMGQGFVYSYETVDEGYVFDEGVYIDPNNLLSGFSMEYLEKIIKYCAENEIELILVNPPMPDGTLNSSKNFQLYVDKISSIAKKNNIQYWDFNLIKKEVLNMERTDYLDGQHLNGNGAGKFSECISKILNGETIDLFYASFVEKIMYNPDGTLR